LERTKQGGFVSLRSRNTLSYLDSVFYSDNTRLYLRDDVDLRWSVVETKRFERSREWMSGSVRTAIVRATNARAVEENPYDWRGKVSSALSLFDECEVLATVSSSDDEASSIVDIRLSFEPTSARVAALLWMSTSLVGMPLAYAWRAQSVRRWRAWSRAVLDRFWGALTPPRARSAYR
jgi:hypothetical protein